MKLLTLDPGLSTGYSIWETRSYFDSSDLELMETGVIEEGCEGFIDDWRYKGIGTKTDRVVCERFVIDGTHTGVWSAQIEGALMALYDGPVIWQLRSDKATLFNQEFGGDAGQTERFAWLRERGFEGEGHELDAITHALVWAKRMGHIPTLRKYWGDE